MNNLFKYLTIVASVVILSACNNDWEDEQFEHYISFKAPLNQQGLTPIYVRYKPDGYVTYQLPLIVSGSNTNEKNMTVHVAVDPDTLAKFNQERFSTRTELFYKQLPTPQFFTIPSTVNIPSGKSDALMPIEFSLANLDLVDKWVVPLTILDDASYNYRSNPKKHYKKALLRVYPFNNFSGEYSATGLQVFIKGSNVSLVPDYKMAYVFDENTVFFYAGLVNEDRLDRGNYKIFVTFNDNLSLTVTTDNPDNNLVVSGSPNYIVLEEMDAVRPYLNRKYVTLNLDYEFTDYTSVPGYPIEFTVSGSLIMERQINIQIPDEDQAILW